LLGLNPSLWEAGAAADFTLTVYGLGFTPNSVVRWNGAERPTTFVSQGELRAAISAADVSLVGTIPVSVYDPSPAPAGTETPPRNFIVLETVFRHHLPMVTR
jgi:hypothetical protein